VRSQRSGLEHSYELLAVIRKRRRSAKAHNRMLFDMLDVLL
jgi:hypothetical protein